jgi:hypothetical protein
MKKQNRIPLYAWAVNHGRHPQTALYHQDAGSLKTTQIIDGVITILESEPWPEPKKAGRPVLRRINNV